MIRWLGLPRVIATVAVAAGAAQAAEEQPPHIVLVMTDDQGYGDVGFTGNPIVQTPEIDALARQSVRFTDFHVDPTCSPTRAALMTGQHSLRAGVWHTIMGRSLLPTERVTIAEALGEAGYRTGIFGKWHLGDNYPYRPNDQGFDTAVIHAGGGVGQTPDFWGNTQFDDTYFVNGEPVRFNGNATDVWFDEAEKFIDTAAAKGEPAFAYVALNAPHRPWRTPEAYVEHYREQGLPEPMAAFYGMITHVDDRLGKLRQSLAALSDGRDVMLIFMTDNGSAFHFNEQFLEGDPDQVVEGLSAQEWTPNAGMRGYKASVYDGGHRVPLLITGPMVEGGRDVDVLAAHYDLFPTLLELAGVKPGGFDLDGVSLLPYLRGHQAEQPDRAIVVTNQRVFDPDPDRPVAVLTPKWRYVVHGEENRAELFDVTADAGQQVNLADQYPDIVTEMQTVLAQWWSSASKGGFPTQRIPIGVPSIGEVRLTAMDWMEAPSTAAVPWFPGFQPPAPELPYEQWLGREDEFTPLPWYVDAAKGGRYRVDVLMHDRAAATPINLPYAVLMVDDQRYFTKVHGLAHAARFEIDIPKGPRRLLAYFSAAPDGPAAVPAYFAYVTPDE